MPRRNTEGIMVSRQSGIVGHCRASFRLSERYAVELIEYGVLWNRSTMPLGCGSWRGCSQCSRRKAELLFWRSRSPHHRPGSLTKLNLFIRFVSERWRRLNVSADCPHLMQAPSRGRCNKMPTFADSGFNPRPPDGSDISF